MAEHWTIELRRENAALREALNRALDALADIPQSRLDKARRCPDADAYCDLAYVTCAQETYDRGQATRTGVLDYLAEQGGY